MSRKKWRGQKILAAGVSGAADQLDVYKRQELPMEYAALGKLALF